MQKTYCQRIFLPLCEQLLNLHYHILSLVPDPRNQNRVKKDFRQSKDTICAVAFYETSAFKTRLHIPDEHGVCLFMNTNHRM